VNDATKQAHTPGPWTVEAPGARDYFAVRTQAGQVAKTGISPRSVHRERGLADAHLIAAAPELLEALVLALPYVEDAAEDPRHKAFRVGDLVKQARAAIIKATEG
jgi:hypothetical protein